MSWKSCGNCKEFLMCPVQTKSALAWCTYWKPIPCPFCGGILSEVREHKTKVGSEDVIRHYRHCFSCHMEFYEEEK